MKIDPVYTTRATEAKIANRAIAIHCSDHRFQEAFREFLTEGLGLVAYTPLAIPGRRPPEFVSRGAAQVRQGQLSEHSISS